LPLGIRRLKLILAYCVNLQEHNESLPAKTTQECGERSKSHFRSFGWVVNKKAREIGLNTIVLLSRIQISYLDGYNTND